MEWKTRRVHGEKAAAAAAAAGAEMVGEMEKRRALWKRARQMNAGASVKFQCQLHFKVENCLRSQSPGICLAIFTAF